MQQFKAFFTKLLAKGKTEGNTSAVAQRPTTKWTPAYITTTVVGILLCVILIPIFIINVTLTIKGAANKDKVPTVFGVAPLIVLSDSMHPLIHKGDLVFIKKTDVTNLKAGDVIAFKEYVNADRWEVVTHRIKEVSAQDGATVYKTKGDNNFGDDLGAVQQANVVGIYSGRVAKIGGFMLKMQEPVGMALFIGVPIVIFIGLDVLRRYLYTKKQAAPNNADTTAQQELEAVRAELERLKAIQADASAKPTADSTKTDTPQQG